MLIFFTLQIVKTPWRWPWVGERVRGAERGEILSLYNKECAIVKKLDERDMKIKIFM